MGIIILALSGDLAVGQTLFQSSGSIFATPNDLNRRHMAPTGKPCLKLDATAKAEIINKDIYEHWISAQNSCGQHIKVRVCYHGSEDCIVIDVPPWGRRDSVLGIYPALQDFRYDSKELF